MREGHPEALERAGDRAHVTPPSRFGLGVRPRRRLPLGGHRAWPAGSAVPADPSAAAGSCPCGRPADLLARRRPRLRLRGCRPEQRDQQQRRPARRRPTISHLAGADVRGRCDRRTPASSQDPDQVDREQHLPAEPHELVVAQPGQRAPQPDEDEQHISTLPMNQSSGHQPELAPSHSDDRPRRPPAAEEQRRARAPTRSPC